MGLPYFGGTWLTFGGTFDLPNFGGTWPTFVGLGLLSWDLVYFGGTSLFSWDLAD